MALLLPSANNVAVMLARYVSGPVDAFVGEMNGTAKSLGMTHTTYTDPSGFDPATVSTAVDQLTLARHVADDDTLTAMMSATSYRLPVAGTVANTNTLLGHDGFVGMKTGSHDAAGGCFMFRTYRSVHGLNTELIGVVLGQRGHNLINAGLYAARQLADRVAPMPVVGLHDIGVDQARFHVDVETDDVTADATNPEGPGVPAGVVQHLSDAGVARPAHRARRARSSAGRRSGGS
jgi:D-alanyl-D-alanine carboxypeptidase